MGAEAPCETHTFYGSQLNCHLYRVQVVFNGATSSQKKDTPMRIPQQTDLGRRVVYRPRGAGRQYGVVSCDLHPPPASSGSTTSTTAARLTRPIWSLPDNQKKDREKMGRGTGSTRQLLPALTMPCESKRIVYPCSSGIEVWSRAWFTTGSLAAVLCPSCGLVSRFGR